MSCHTMIEFHVSKTINVIVHQTFHESTSNDSTESLESALDLIINHNSLMPEMSLF